MNSLDKIIRQQRKHSNDNNKMTTAIDNNKNTPVHTNAVQPLCFEPEPARKWSLSNHVDIIVTVQYSCDRFSPLSNLKCGQFFLDPDGRVPFAGEVSFDFRSAPEALASSLSKPGVLDRVIADCQVPLVGEFDLLLFFPKALYCTWYISNGSEERHLPSDGIV